MLSSARLLVVPLNGKLDIFPRSSIRMTSNTTIGALICVPFSPVRVLRNLGPYGQMLHLEPNVSKAPDSEFLVQLLTGHTTHQAYLRHHAGSHYKNLENLIRGKHESSLTSKRLIANRLGISIEDVEKLASSALDGPLMPSLLEGFQWIEGVPRLALSWLLNRDVLCPCCGKNVLDDVDIWWGRHVPAMRPDEYRFAERLLRALIGRILIESFFAASQKQDGQHPNYLIHLASPSRHPIGNWLSEAQKALSCSNMAELAATMQLRGDPGMNFSKDRLKKWSSGQDVMPITAGEAIDSACGQSKSLMAEFHAARTIALISDFIASSLHVSSNGSTKIIAREAVFKRIEQLYSNLRLSLWGMHSKIPKQS